MSTPCWRMRSDHSILSMFHSVDGGTTWTARAVPPNLGTQAWSDLCIAVHPDNPGVVIVGNVNVARSLDFGVHWEMIIDWVNHTSVDRAQHGDNHTLVFDVTRTQRLWVGNDGGISFTAGCGECQPDDGAHVAQTVARSVRFAVQRHHGPSELSLHDGRRPPGQRHLSHLRRSDLGDCGSAAMAGRCRSRSAIRGNYIAPNQSDTTTPNHINLVMSAIVNASSRPPRPRCVRRIADADTDLEDVIAMSDSLRRGTVALLNAFRAWRALRPERAASPAGSPEPDGGTLRRHRRSAPRRRLELRRGRRRGRGRPRDSVTALAYGPGATAAASRTGGSAPTTV